MRFKEFLALEDLTPQQPNPNNPLVKQNTVKTLQNVGKLPVPAGVNPGVYKAKLQNAMNVARQGNAANASDAVNTVNVQNSLTQN